MGQSISSILRRSSAPKPTISRYRPNPTPLKPPVVQGPKTEAFQKNENDLAWQATKLYYSSHLDISTHSINTGQNKTPSTPIPTASDPNSLSNTNLESMVQVLSKESPDKILLDKGWSKEDIAALHRYYSVAIRPPKMNDLKEKQVDLTP